MEKNFQYGTVIVRNPGETLSFCSGDEFTKLIFQVTFCIGEN